MPDEIAQAEEPIQAQSHDSFIDRLAKKIGKTARAETVYGDPVERDGITVIPVARVRYALGGGWGKGKGKGIEAEGEGGGGGGAVLASPIGYIELKNGQSKFRRIGSGAVPLIIAGGFMGFFFLRKLRRLLNKNKPSRYD